MQDSFNSLRDISKSVKYIYNSLQIPLIRMKHVLNKIGRKVILTANIKILRLGIKDILKWE